MKRLHNEDKANTVTYFFHSPDLLPPWSAEVILIEAFFFMIRRLVEDERGTAVLCKRRDDNEDDYELCKTAHWE